MGVGGTREYKMRMRGTRKALGVIHARGCAGWEEAERRTTEVEVEGGIGTNMVLDLDVKNCCLGLHVNESCTQTK